jgi:fibronectin type 3 domain-containing protein
LNLKVAIATLVPSLRRASFVPFAILAILFAGIVGLVIFRVAADQKSHSVLLKWDPPPKPTFAVVGYNVYRSQSDGEYARIASKVPATTYTDRGASDGKTYHYLVRAVGADGRESPISNQVSVTIR